MTQADPSEIVSQVEEFVGGCLKRGKLNLISTCRAQDGTIHVDLEGEDSELVLQKNARLLYALNHLVNQAFYHRTGRQFNFVVDCHDYRGTRTSELQLLARKAAEQASLSGRRFALQPMPSSERRIIHLTLAEDPGVETRSEGRGMYRRVVIHPGGQMVV